MSWIIHIFSVLHAALSLSLRYLGWADDMALTMLTMTMVVLICIRKKVAVEFFAVSIIVVNVIGYFLGMLGAHVLSTFIQAGPAVNALSTFVTTEILGWSIVYLSRFSERDKNFISYLKYIILAFLLVVFFRLLLVNIFSGLMVENMYDVVIDSLNNSISIILLVCADVIFVKYSPRFYKQISASLRFGIIVLYVLGFSALLSLLLSSSGGFALVFMVNLVIHVAVFCLVYMFYSVQESKSELNRAEFKYLKLKRQVDPHFLFNSLNILDCLICDGKTEQASEFTHKLASIYRYMIKSEEMQLVSLNEELKFVGLYMDLLRVRFPQGLEVQMSIKEGSENRMLPPCVVQLLVENAIKHNVVNPSNPLIVRIVSTSSTIEVSNNTIPKISSSPSTGLGQKYIRRQYLDLCAKNIVIDDGGSYYRVILPLL